MPARATESTSGMGPLSVIQPSYLIRPASPMNSGVSGPRAPLADQPDSLTVGSAKAPVRSCRNEELWPDV